MTKDVSILFFSERFTRLLFQQEEINLKKKKIVIKSVFPGQLMVSSE